MAIARDLISMVRSIVLQVKLLSGEPTYKKTSLDKNTVIGPSYMYLENFVYKTIHPVPPLFKTLLS